MTVVGDQTELANLELPRRADLLGMARLVVASVAATVEGIDDDRIEDLRVAVTEVCTQLVVDGATVGAAALTVRCLLREDALAVRIEGGDLADLTGGDGDGADPLGGDGAAPEETSQGGWATQLIEALVDEVANVPAGDGVAGAIELVVRRTA